MKMPKKVKRLCPYCKVQTEQKVTLLATGATRGSLKWGSMQRAKLRGKARGFGNKGKWGSKPAASKWKRKSKSTKRLVVMYTCSKCKKSKQARSRRLSKIIIE